MSSPTVYDAVIVGAGFSGAVTAWQLASNGYQVLILEAGPGAQNRQSYINNFYANSNKFPEAPYPGSPYAPSPDVANLAQGTWNNPKQSYFVYTQPADGKPGSIPYGSTYERLSGGTGWHWLGTTLRFNDNDFKLYSNYLKPSGYQGESGGGWTPDPGVDWPIGYADLETWYEQAEAVIGVAADVADQQYPTGPTYRQGYQYPMPKISQSYLDQMLGTSVDDMRVTDSIENQSLLQQYANYLSQHPLKYDPLNVRSTPQGRNSIGYDGRPPCMGNTNCVPLCPIAAKYDPTVHLNKALAAGARLITQAVAYNVRVDDPTKTNPKVTGIDYKRWDGTTATAVGKVYFIGGHAVETPKLLLMSNKQIPHGVGNSSDTIGRYLMDHNAQLSWGLMPAGKPVYPFRGPLSTSGVEELRDGSFRGFRGAFRIEVGNDAWNWPTGAPSSNVTYLLSQGVYGKQLQSQLADVCSRMIRFASLVEPIPDPDNRVTVSPDYTDALGIPRPLVNYKLNDYEAEGLRAGRNAVLAIMKQLGATDSLDLLGTYLDPSPGNTAYVEHCATPQGFFGAGHLMGTYRMGTDPTSSATDSYSRSHDHPNLFIMGCGNYPSVGTSNPTLTMMALVMRTCDYVLSNWNDVSA